MGGESPFFLETCWRGEWECEDDSCFYKLSGNGGVAADANEAVALFRKKSGER